MTGAPRPDPIANGGSRMLRCREVTRLIASEELVDAGWLSRMGAWLHLAMCRHCRGYARQLRAIGSAAREVLGGRARPDEASLLRLEATVIKDLSARGPL